VKGIYFDVVGGNWTGVTNDLLGSPNNCTVTGGAVAANTWYRLRITKTGGSVEFFVNGTSIGTCSTHVPSGNHVLAESKRNSSSSSITVDTDYVSLCWSGLSR
jgi:hypothetical protein